MVLCVCGGGDHAATSNPNPNPNPNLNHFPIPNPNPNWTSNQAWAVLEVNLENYEKGKELILGGLKVDANHGACWSIIG